MSLVLRLCFASAALLAASVSARAYSCSASVGELNFGHIDVLTGATYDATASVQISCNFGPLEGLTQVRACLSIGNGSGGRDSSARYMTNGTQSLAYQLYTVPYSTTWGDRAQSFPVVPTVNLNAGNPSATVTLYGRIFGSQSGKPFGSYQSYFGAADVSFKHGLNVFGLVACDAIDLSLLLGGAVLNPQFDVKAEVDKICNVATYGFNFGNRGALTATILDNHPSIGVTCSKDAEYFVGLDDGENSTGVRQRRMRKGSEYIAYDLLKSSTVSDAWGNTGTFRKQGTGTGSEVLLQVYGRVPAQSPTPSVGTYVDNVAVTLTF